jgi:hypothetical protein
MTEQERIKELEAALAGLVRTSAAEAWEEWCRCVELS